MAVFDEHINFAWSLIQTPPSPAISGASIVVENPERFGATPFKAWAVPNGQRASKDNAEVVDVLSGSGTVGDPYIIERAEEGSTAKAIAGGWILIAGITAGIIEVIEYLLLTHTHDGTDETAILTTGGLVNGEVPAGSVNGTNTLFTTSVNYATGSLKVFLNGQRLKSGAGNDFIETGNNGFTMQYAPETGDVLAVDYTTTNTLLHTGTTSFKNEYVVGNVGDVTNTLYTTPTPYVPGSLKVYKNGVRMRRNDDYTETTPSTGLFTFATAVLTGSTILADYQESVSVAGNADTLDGFHANQNPTANQIPVVDPTGSLLTGIVGEVKQGFWSVLPAGWLWLHGGTIGSAASGANVRANADVFALYSVLWSSLTDTTSPMFTSAGAASSRGASALADFNANKRLTMPTNGGRAMVGLSAGETEFNALGKTGGAKTHTLTTAELASHAHGLNTTGEGFWNWGGHTILRPGSGAGTEYMTRNVNNDTAANGGGQAHNNLQPYLVVDHIIKY